jgi:hypothetical protein
VVIMWFLKCRLADRQNFVFFIIRSLNHNLVRWRPLAVWADLKSSHKVTKKFGQFFWTIFSYKFVRISDKKIRTKKFGQKIRTKNSDKFLIPQLWTKCYPKK